MQNKEYATPFSGWYLRPKPVGIFGNPDFGNKTRKIAVFIDDCLLNGCTDHSYVMSKTSALWKARIAANKKRNRLVTKTLLDDWWTVGRLWEHEVRKSSRQSTRGVKREQVEV